MSKNQYNPGKLPSMFEFLVLTHKKDPDMFDDPTKLWAHTATYFKSLHDKTKCPNCRASMLSYWFEFDAMDAGMLINMSKVVRYNLGMGKLFTQANQVHVPSMQYATYAMKSRTTKMSKLGLIAKVIENGRQKGGTWLITRRGWLALANQPIPKKIESFRNEVDAKEDRAEVGKITIREVLSEYQRNRSDLLRRGKKVKNDYTGEIEEHRRHDDWIHIGNIQAGELL